MLQQTQVDRVRKYFERTLEAFSTLQDLAKADWDAFFPYYDGLGYYRRGQNMLKLAKTVINEYI